jgi:hypothetical protein
VGNDPGSGVDLHPGDAYGSSDARATNGSLQVGHVTLGTGSGQRQHAALWEGSPDSFVDLHALLPAGACQRD